MDHIRNRLHRRAVAESWCKVGSIAAVLNLWAAAHWWAADLCLVGRDQGSDLRIFFDVSHMSQSMKRYQVLVVELELPLHT